MSTWSTPKPLSVGTISSTNSPSLTQFGANLYLLYLSSDNYLSSTNFDGSTWDTGQKITTNTNALVPAVGSPAAAEYHGHLYAVYQASSSDQSARLLVGQRSNSNPGNSALWVNSGQINTKTGLKLALYGTPALTVFNDLLYLVIKNKTGNGGLLYSSYDGNTWQDAVTIPNVSVNASSTPTIASYNGLLFVIYEGSQDNPGKLYWITFDGAKWSDPKSISTPGNTSLLTDGFPTATVFNGLLYVAYPATGTPPAIWTTGFNGTSWSTAVKIDCTPGTVTGAPSISMMNSASAAYMVFQGTGSSVGTLYYTSQNTYYVKTPVPLLDVWGEGRIVDTIVTGFEQALNLNKAGQLVSNGRNSNGAIPRLVPVSQYDNPTFPIADGLVSYVTLMGAPITTTTAKEMYRVLNKSVGVVMLYGADAKDRETFEANMGKLIYKPNDPLKTPFNQPTISPVYIYGFPGVTDHDEL